MDLKKSIIVLVLFTLTLAQLNENDKNIIKNNLLTFQDEASGIFNKNLQDTYKAVFALSAINVQIPNVSRICKDLSFESEHNQVTSEHIELNKLLNCKLTLTNAKGLENEYSNIKQLHEDFTTNYLLGNKIDYNGVWKKLSEFYVDTNQFVNSKEDTAYSLRSTGYGLHIISKIYSKLSNDTRNDMAQKFRDTYDNVVNEFKLISDVL